MRLLGAVIFLCFSAFSAAERILRFQGRGRAEGVVAGDDEQLGAGRKGALGRARGPTSRRTGAAPSTYLRTVTREMPNSLATCRCDWPSTNTL